MNSYSDYYRGRPPTPAASLSTTPQAGGLDMSLRQGSPPSLGRSPTLAQRQPVGLPPNSGFLGGVSAQRQPAQRNTSALMHPGMQLGSDRQEAARKRFAEIEDRREFGRWQLQGKRFGGQFERTYEDYLAHKKQMEGGPEIQLRGYGGGVQSIQPPTGSGLGSLQPQGQQMFKQPSLQALQRPTPHSPQGGPSLNPNGWISGHPGVYADRPAL